MLHEKTEMRDERQNLFSKLCLSFPISDKKKETKNKRKIRKKKKSRKEKSWWNLYTFSYNYICIFDNILETSTSPFYIKIMYFAGFFCVQIHSWNANISRTLHSFQGEEQQPDTELFLLVALFIYYVTCGVERRELWVGDGEKGEGNRSLRGTLK